MFLARPLSVQSVFGYSDILPAAAAAAGQPAARILDVPSSCLPPPPSPVRLRGALKRWPFVRTRLSSRASTRSRRRGAILGLCILRVMSPPSPQVSPRCLKFLMSKLSGNQWPDNQDVLLETDLSRYARACECLHRCIDASRSNEGNVERPVGFQLDISRLQRL